MDGPTERRNSTPFAAQCGNDKAVSTAQTAAMIGIIIVVVAFTISVLITHITTVILTASGFRDRLVANDQPVSL